jgi:hypothetical protein
MFIKVIITCLALYLVAARDTDIVQGKGNVITGAGGNVVIGDSNEVHTIDPKTDANFYKSTMDDLKARFNTKFADDLGNPLKNSALKHSDVPSV